MTEMELRSLYVQTLRGYYGAEEGDARHRELIDLYNSMEVLPRGYRMTYTADWCVATAVAIGVKLGITEIILPECSCTRQIRQYKAIGRFEGCKDYVPQIGDFVIYDWQGDNDPDHWGTVTRIEGKALRIIEGNMADKVWHRDIEVGDERIYGYCLPDYAAMAAKLSRPRSFADVPAGAWYADAVEYCAQHGLMQGRGEGVFAPEALVTRAELAAVAMRLHRELAGM